MANAKDDAIRIRDTVRGEPQRFFDAQGVDELVSISMALAQELWTVKERLTVIEAAAAAKGVLLSDEIERFKLSEAQQARLDADRAVFIDRIFFVLREQAEGLKSRDPAEPAPPAL
jgi:hypothetical protein